MNINVFHVQVFLFDCPCAKLSPLQRPLDDLADRLRKEMRYGRDAGRGADSPGRLISDIETAFQHCPIRN